MRPIKHIVLHCTASQQSQSLASIQAHWNRLGWRRPGYHRLIAADGTVHHLADYSQVTNGVAGHNSNSIHIAYIGGVDANGRPVDNRTQQQRAAMLQLIYECAALFPQAVICGHRDFSPDKNRNGVIEPHEWVKACPSFSVREWLREVNYQPKQNHPVMRTIARLNLREGAGTKFAVRQVLPTGTTVKVIQYNPNWSFVSVNGITGWVSSTYIAII